MEKRREDKCIILKIPRSQWVNRKSKLMGEKLLMAVNRVKAKRARSRS